MRTFALANEEKEEEKEECTLARAYIVAVSASVLTRRKLLLKISYPLLKKVKRESSSGEGTRTRQFRLSRLEKILCYV